MPKRDAVNGAADELYALPPGEFTSARDERAKQLRADGDREAANAVKSLRRPTVAAWTLNQLARRRRKDLDRLLAAGEELRAAQEELVAGGDRAGFQDAVARERDLVAKLSADAAALAGEAGERGTGLQEKVAATLHAAALDEDTAEELRAGRMVKEREAIGGFGELGETPARSRRASRPKPKSQKRSSSSAKQDRQDAERRQDADRRQRQAAARTDERHARRELDAAERAVQHAQERAEAAEAHAREANERARTTAERLKEARRAQAAARKAHTRAERALAKAEAGSS